MDFSKCEFFPCNVGARIHLTHLSAGFELANKNKEYETEMFRISNFGSVYEYGF